MNEPVRPDASQGLKILETRVYYDARSGEILHVHQYALAGDAEPPDFEHLSELMDAGETAALRCRPDADVAHLVVDASGLAPGASYRVDLAGRCLSEVAEAAASDR